MYFMNILDEKQRFVRLDIYDNGKTGQADSHTYSYLFCREQYKEMGDIMGLDKLVYSLSTTEKSKISPEHNSS